MARHLQKCIYKVELNTKKSDVIFLLKKQRRSDETEDLAVEELKNFLTDSYKRTIQIYQRVIKEKNKNPIEKIKEMNVSESTMQNYLLEWKLFTRWAKRNEKPISADSANTYIAALSNLQKRASTIRKKHNTLQLILQQVFDRNVVLNKFRMRITYAPKKPLTDKELYDYLEEQREIDTQDYIIQLLLATYGLRINTAARLRVKDLEFMFLNNEEEPKIHLPDSKVKNRRLEPISPELQEVLRNFTKGYTDVNSYVFYKTLFPKDPKKRAQDLCMKINKRIQNTKVLKKVDNYKYSSHMFRKTVAYNMYHTQEKLIRDQVRSKIGQSQGSNAIVHYI